EERVSLLTRARQFLLSPQVRYEDDVSKRRFLQEKGLSEDEIGLLLREQAPVVPPRTYPQLPPSNLPSIIAGVLRIVLWGAGAGAALVLFYYRFLLPRLTRSANARRSLKAHQVDLLSRLTSSLRGLQETQRETFAVLPMPTSDEPPPYLRCKSVDEVIEASKESRAIPEVSLLRCTLADLREKAAGPTSEELFELLYAKLPWLERDVAYREKLWTVLNDSPRFYNSTESDSDPAHWSYVPPPSPPPPASTSTISSLLASLSTLLSVPLPRTQHTLEALIDLTGYLTTETYELGLASRALRLPSGIPPSGMSPQEEEVRKEIKALKGLVLNR
ncbi:hypothetical protein K488DRAFT_38585, partial [Vararia minispora EC-137]